MSRHLCLQSLLVLIHLEHLLLGFGQLLEPARTLRLQLTGLRHPRLHLRLELSIDPVNLVRPQVLPHLRAQLGLTDPELCLYHRLSLRLSSSPLLFLHLAQVGVRVLLVYVLHSASVPDFEAVSPSWSIGNRDSFPLFFEMLFLYNI